MYSSRRSEGSASTNGSVLQCSQQSVELSTPAPSAPPAVKFKGVCLESQGTWHNHSAHAQHTARACAGRRHHHKTCTPVSTCTVGTMLTSWRCWSLIWSANYSLMDSNDLDGHVQHFACGVTHVHRHTQLFVRAHTHACTCTIHIEKAIVEFETSDRIKQ